jgi:hypothetical protein
MAPSFPPTIAPTAYGTSSVHVKLKLTTTSDFTENDQETVLAEVKTQFAGKEIKNFDTIIFTERRRALLDLNATVTWRVSFDIVVAPDGNSEVFWGKELVANVLSTVKNPSFASRIMTSVPKVIDVSVLVVGLDPTVVVTSRNSTSSSHTTDQIISASVELRLKSARNLRDTDRGRLLTAIKSRFDGKEIENFRITNISDANQVPAIVYWLVRFDVAEYADFETKPKTVISLSNATTLSRLVLAFSRNLDDYPEAKERSLGIQAAIEAQEEPWTRYFSPDVALLSCDNDEEDDLYSPEQQGTSDEFGNAVRWVNGPNRQFEKMMRFVMEQIPNGLVFVKEFDTLPQMNNHFGNLLEEIYRNQPFNILGR